MEDEMSHLMNLSVGVFAFFLLSGLTGCVEEQMDEGRSVGNHERPETIEDDESGFGMEFFEDPIDDINILEQDTGLEEDDEFSTVDDVTDVEEDVAEEVDSDTVQETEDDFTEEPLEDTGLEEDDEFFTTDPEEESVEEWPEDSLCNYHLPTIGDGGIWATDVKFTAIASYAAESQMSVPGQSNILDFRAVNIADEECGSDLFIRAFDIECVYTDYRESGWYPEDFEVRLWGSELMESETVDEDWSPKDGYNNYRATVVLDQMVYAPSTSVEIAVYADIFASRDDSMWCSVAADSFVVSDGYESRQLAGWEIRGALIHF